MDWQRSYRWSSGTHCTKALQWRHNERDGVSIIYSTVCSGADQRKHRITGLCEGNSPVADEFPTQRASNTENVFIWWRHHGFCNLEQYHACWCPGSLSRQSISRHSIECHNKKMVCMASNLIWSWCGNVAHYKRTIVMVSVNTFFFFKLWSCLDAHELCHITEHFSEHMATITQII